jgi:hypothetical protein
MRPLVTHEKYYWAYPRYEKRGMWHVRHQQQSKLGVLCGVYSHKIVYRQGDESKSYCRKCYKLYLMELMA